MQTLRLASYNIRKAVGLDWRRDPDRVMRVIGTLGADVVALQEADRRAQPRHAALPEEMLEERTGLRPVEVARSRVSLGWHGNALLVRPGIEVVEVGHIPLPGIEPRGAVRTLLETPIGRISVFATHLGLRRGCRRQQFRLLSEHAADTPSPVILGDFNEWSQWRPLEGLAPHFHIVKPGHSFHASRPVASLDRFALGPGLGCVDAGVETDGEARRASDHLPVWCEIAPQDAQEVAREASEAGTGP